MGPATSRGGQKSQPSPPGHTKQNLQQKPKPNLNSSEFREVTFEDELAALFKPDSHSDEALRLSESLIVFKVPLRVKG